MHSYNDLMHMLLQFILTLSFNYLQMQALKVRITLQLVQFLMGEKV